MCIVKRYILFDIVIMEKQKIVNSTHNKTLKNMLAVWALSLVLLGNPDNIVAQTQKTREDLAKNINKTNEDIIKQYFVNNFAPVINSVNHISDIPLKIKYKNPDFAAKYNFPDSIDISPKLIKWSPKRLVVVTIDDKKYNIIPYRGIKIKNMKIVPNKTLDDPKAILTLELIWFIPWDIQISCKEFAQYIYDLSRLDVWQKMSVWWIHVEVLKDKERLPIQKNPTRQITDTSTQATSVEVATISQDKE